MTNNIRTTFLILCVIPGWTNVQALYNETCENLQKVHLQLKKADSQNNVVHRLSMDGTIRLIHEYKTSYQNQTILAEKVVNSDNSIREITK